MALEEVAACLAGLPAPVLAVYEAGPTGFELAHDAAERSIDVRIVAPGSIPKGSGDRVKTYRRDAIRLVSLVAAGELHVAFVASVAGESFRDLIRCIEDLARRSDARAASPVESPAAGRSPLPGRSRRGPLAGGAAGCSDPRTP